MGFLSFYFYLHSRITLIPLTAQINNLVKKGLFIFVFFYIKIT